MDDIRKITLQIVLQDRQLLTRCLAGDVDQGVPHTDPSEPIQGVARVHLELHGDGRLPSSLYDMWLLLSCHVDVDPIIRWSGTLLVGHGTSFNPSST